MYEYEINFEPITEEDKKGCDEWGAAFMWLNDDQTAGVEYNLCYDNGVCDSAFYKMEMNYNNKDYPEGYLETDPCTYELYEIDFNDNNWKEKFIKAMEDAMLNFFKPFTDDIDKMTDFFILSKEEFLSSYSYITEEEYDLTARDVAKTIINRKKGEN